jgi:hypothetical protein
MEARSAEKGKVAMRNARSNGEMSSIGERQAVRTAHGIRLGIVARI